MYFATVSLSTAYPSFASSLAILRRLQSGFSSVICSMRLTSSRASGGRPTRRDFHAHHRAKPRRCHPITVAGWTIARHSAHRDHIRETMTQNARSIGRSRGRGVARRRIASCWRSTRFSANRSARGRNAASSAPTTASRIAFTTGDHRPVHRRCHRRIGALVSVRWPRAYFVDSPPNRVENEFLASTGSPNCRSRGRQPRPAKRPTNASTERRCVGDVRG